MKHLPVLFSLLLFSSGPVYAYPFIAAPVISGLSNCGVIKNDNGSWQVTFSVDWLDMPANPPGSSLNRRVSRGIVIYLYDKKGKSIDGYLPRSSITMNGVILEIRTALLNSKKVIWLMETMSLLVGGKTLAPIQVKSLSM